MKKTLNTLTAIALITCGVSAYGQVELSSEAQEALNQANAAAQQLDEEMTRLKSAYRDATGEEKKQLRRKLDAFDNKVEQAEENLDRVEDRWCCPGSGRCPRCNVCR